MTIEMRLDQKGHFDELVCADCFIHFEMMDDDHLWIGVTDREGTTTHVNVSVINEKIQVLAETDR